MKLIKKFQNPDGPLDVTYIPQTDNIQPQILERPRLALPTNYVPGVGVRDYQPVNLIGGYADDEGQHSWTPEVWKQGDKRKRGGLWNTLGKIFLTKEQKEEADERWRQNKAKKYDEKMGIIRDKDGYAHYIVDPNDPSKPGDIWQQKWYWDSLSPQEKYAYQTAVRQGNSTDNFRRLYDITKKIVSDKRNLDENGNLNQRGYKKLSDDQNWGYGSDYMTNRDDLGSNIGLALTAGTTAVAAPGLYGLAAKIPQAIITNPVETFGAIGGNIAFNNAWRLGTGQTWHQYWTDTGVHPLIAEALNPGNYLGMGYARNVARRGLEAVARTQGGANPIGPAWENFKAMPWKRRGAIGKYILTGKTTGPKFYSRSFNAKGGDTGYSGFWQFDTNSEGANDVLDAYFYGKEIDPKFGLKRISKGNKEDFGTHSSYVEKNYSGKSKDIPVYEQELPSYYKRVPSGNKINETGSVDAENGFSNYDLEGWGIDAAGHRKVTGIDADTGEEVFMNQDIWKFQPEEYYKKWLNVADLNSGKKPGFWKRTGLKLGLKYMDRLGTAPVITRTPWYYPDNFGGIKLSDISGGIKLPDPPTEITLPDLSGGIDLF